MEWTGGEGEPPGIDPELAGPGKFRSAFAQFMITVAGVVQLRATKAEVRRLGELAAIAAGSIREQLESGEVAQAIDAMLESRWDALAISLLVEEMQYYTWRYREAAPPELWEALHMSELERKWGADSGDVDSDEAIDDADTVFSSIDKILDKLPKPLRKLVEALRELLKLALALG